MLHERGLRREKALINRVWGKVSIYAGVGRVVVIRMVVGDGV